MVLQTFLLGALTMGGWVAAAFFFRFWRSTKDRLFLFFAGAFLTLSVDWAALALTNPMAETRHYVFAIRLFAFLLIIVGIVEKNRKRDRS